jgi:hypothetical protein
MTTPNFARLDPDRPEISGTVLIPSLLSYFEFCSVLICQRRSANRATVVTPKAEEYGAKARESVMAAYEEIRALDSSRFHQYILNNTPAIARATPTTTIVSI